MKTNEKQSLKCLFDESAEKKPILLTSDLELHFMKFCWCESEREREKDDKTAENITIKNTLKHRLV